VTSSPFQDAVPDSILAFDRQAVARQRVLAAAGTYSYTPLTGSGMSNEDVLATLRGYAAGRCPVG
jgi:hypothetical protein